MRTLSIAFTILLIFNLSQAQYLLKANVLDEGGKKITSANYICQFSFAQPIASLTLSNQNYKATLGFWHPPYNGGLVGIKEELTNNISSPLLFSLSSPNPNPFKTKTTIRYSLPKETKVSLKVLDCEGKIIRILVQTKQKPGVYNVTWDLKNSKLPSGIYFYRLETDEYTQTRKLIKIE